MERAEERLDHLDRIGVFVVRKCLSVESLAIPTEDIPQRPSSVAQRRHGTIDESPESAGAELRSDHAADSLQLSRKPAAHHAHDF